MIESWFLASNRHSSFSQQLEFKARIVHYRSNRRATKTVHMIERRQLFVVRRDTGSSNARNIPAERFALLIFEILLIGSGDGLTGVLLHCDPRRNGKHCRFGVIQIRCEVVKATSYRLSQLACRETSKRPQAILLMALLVQQMTWRIWCRPGASNWKIPQHLYITVKRLLRMNL